MTAEPSPSLLSLVGGHQPDHLAPAVSHEHLFVSALLDSGVYNPRQYGVPHSAMRGLSALHDFCLKHQESDGFAPSVEAVQRKFPSFVHTPGVGPAWAASEVMKAETNRSLRKGISKALAAVGDEAHAEAIGILRETVQGITTANRPGTLVTDFSGTRSAESRPVCPVPAGVLSGLTGGHGAAQLWFYAALWGVAKTWKLLEHAVIAAEGGWDATIFSMEMHTEDILGRIRQIALRNLGKPLSAYTLDEQEMLMHEWAESAGTIEVRGPDQGRVDASVIAGSVTTEKTLVVVDYVGKMYTSDGRYAGEGHEAIAQCSKELQQTAGLMNIPILGAAQINRMGDVAGTVSLEQDADLIVEVQRVAKTVNSIRRLDIRKTRHTAMIGHWYQRFDPMLGRFDDITNEEAMALRMAEESLLYS